MSSSSQESESTRRCCPKCNKRISSLANDRHSFCSSCRGQECDDSNKCQECVEWSKESFEKYIKHQRSLIAKAKSKAKKDQSDSSSGVIGTDHPGHIDRVEPGQGVSEDRVLTLIQESIAGLSSSFSDALKESFSNIAVMVDERVGQLRQDVTNTSSLPGNPSHPPVSSPPCQGQRDPSRPKPHTTYGKVGAESVESEGDELTDPPPSNVLALLRRAGVVIPEHIARSVISESNSSGDGMGLNCNSQGSLRSQGAGPSSDGLGGSQGLAGSAGQGSLGAVGSLGNVRHSQGQGSLSQGGISSGNGDGLGGTSQSGSAGVRFGSSDWYDSSINRGASSSREGLFSGVTFDSSDCRVERGDDDDEGDSVLGEKVSASEGLRRVLHMIFALCPDAAPQSDSKPAKSCNYEGMFGEPKQAKEDLNPMLFHRVGEILVEVGKHFQSFSESGKSLQHSLPNRRRSYATADAPSLANPVKANSSVPRLVGSVAASKGLNCNYGEISKLEGVAKQGLEAQSLAFWCFSALLKWIKNEGFKPGEPQFFEELIQAFSLAMVNATSSMASISTFCHAKRREGILSHFPPHIGDHFKALLQASSFAGEFLFDDETLGKVLSESREDSAVSANVAISKGFSFPIFGKTKQSQDSKAASPVVPKSQVGQKGKGKGWQKRKGQGSQAQGNPKSPKSAKVASSSGSSSSGQGKGFQK